MRRWAVVLLFFVISCSQGHKTASPVTPVSPLLKITTKENACLDFESIVTQMAEERFSFPGLIYTQDFEVLSSTDRQEFLNSLYARSWRYDNVNVSSLNDFKGVTQQGCQSIALPDFNALRLPYQITGYSAKHLELKLDRQALADSLKDLPQDQREAILSFPNVNRWIITAHAPTRLELTSYYEAVPTICVDAASPQIRETLIYQWADNQPMAIIASQYWSKLEALANAPTLRPFDIFETNIGFTPVDQTTAAKMTATLENRTYEICN